LQIIRIPEFSRRVVPCRSRDGDDDLHDVGRRLDEARPGVRADLSEVFLLLRIEDETERPILDSELACWRAENFFAASY